LILGGTAEARQLASILTATGRDVVSSLAGRVHDPSLPPGRVRIGGFGGIDGLARYLRAAGISTVVDATHPFAVQMSSNAAAAADLTGIPLVRLERPSWSNHPRADSWCWVPDAPAARAAAEHAFRPFLTSGRQSLNAFQRWVDRPVLARVVDLPEIPLPPNWTVLTSRGPYSYAGERQTMIDHSVELLITKDSGGSYTAAKLDAAHDLDIEVVIIARPRRPTTARVESIAQAMTWLRRSDEAPMPRTS
jgi:precorrin-6A/cobalt-precorrin-6A reductase